MEGVLRSSWDSKLLAAAVRERSIEEAHLNQAEEEVQEDLSSVTLTACQTAAEFVKSDFLWAFTHLIAIIREALDHLFNFMETCPCHSRDKGHTQSKTLCGGPCPLKTCRAPECAAGKVRDIMQHHLEQSDLQLVQACALLNKADSDVLITSFKHAQAGLMQLVDIKLGHFTVFPALLCGLAHHDEHEAKKVAQRCLSERQATQPEHLDSLTSQILQDIGDQLELFAT